MYMYIIQTPVYVCRYERCCSQQSIVKKKIGIKLSLITEKINMCRVCVKFNYLYDKNHVFKSNYVIILLSFNEFL